MKINNAEYGEHAQEECMVFGHFDGYILALGEDNEILYKKEDPEFYPIGIQADRQGFKSISQESADKDTYERLKAYAEKVIVGK